MGEDEDQKGLMFQKRSHEVRVIGMPFRLRLGVTGPTHKPHWPVVSPTKKDGQRFGGRMIVHLIEQTREVTQKLGNLVAIKVDLRNGFGR